MGPTRLRSQRPRTAPVIALLLPLLSPAAMSAGSCGLLSLLDLATLLGREPSAEARQAIEGSCPGRTCSMRDIAGAGSRVGIELHGVVGELSEVGAALGPAIIHLSKPDHFVVLARLSEEWAQVIDSGAVLAVPRAELEKRYSGHALVLADEAPTDGARAPSRCRLRCRHSGRSGFPTYAHVLEPR